jgi:hypothetical protein
MKQCLFCKKPIKDTPGRRPKKYCDDNCRQKHFQAKRRNNKAADPFSKKSKKSTKKIKGDLQKAEDGKVKFVPKKTGKTTLVEPTELDSKVDFKVGVDTFDTDKSDTLADEPKMWQDGEPNPPYKFTPAVIYDANGKAMTEEEIAAEMNRLSGLPQKGHNPRKVVNPDAPRTKQKLEPAEGSNAFFLKYGAYYKKDIPK